ncbi:MAG: sigma-70 family RNA polymerase sigma factor [Acetobacter sp.]|uniref:RNA polymerase sigma factor n=1 Tax=unclassified Acetobacter TaxID=2628570 RepID=UPI0025C2E7CE|nr:sigma-70 family RNA polymerase sigma factor [Acetobacter sp. UBA5411]
MKSKHPSFELYEEHRPGLLSYARQLSGDAVLAEDIVQDAWLLFARQSAGTIVSPGSYLRTIVRNLLMTRARRAKIERMSEADFDVVSATVADDAVSPEETVAARETMMRVMEALDALPEQQAEAIRLYHFEGMKLREVAAVLGLSISMVHGLITEGLAICNRIRKEGQ